MNEYIIEVCNKNGEVTHLVVMLGDRKTPSLTIATPSGYRLASKFKVKERAKKVSDKFDGSRVVPSFGGYVNSTKTCVAPLKNKVNSAPAYRTI